MTFRETIEWFIKIAECKEDEDAVWQLKILLEYCERVELPQTKVPDMKLSQFKDVSISLQVVIDKLLKIATQLGVSYSQVFLGPEDLELPEEAFV